MSSPIPPENNTWTVDPIGNRATATSSPPPPGFVAKNLWSENGAVSTTENSEISSPQYERRRNEKTPSFNKLEAALGSGLAESMEDATRSDHLSQNNLDSNVPSNLTDSFFNPSKNNDMTHERHERHSRLIGATGTSSPSQISHKAPEAGSLFGALNNDNNSRKVGGPSTVSLPFSQDPTVPAFRPSYETTSSLQLNNNQNNNTHDGESSDHGKSRLPVTKDLGCTVMEPSDTSYGGGSGSKVATNYSTDLSYGIQADMESLNLWSAPGARGGNSSVQTQLANRTIEQSNNGHGLGDRLSSPSGTIHAEDELRPFTWDTNHHEPSRTLAILNALNISPNDIISFCENFGVTEAIRSEFSERLGVVFISFFDMRCAQFAAMQLPGMLQRLMGGHGAVQVKFCVPLNSSSQNDESLVVIKNLPHQIGVDNLGRILSSFGGIRSLKNLGGDNYGGNFVAEFHDVQDARKTVFELENTQPWGHEVSIEVGGRNPADRKKGRELLAVLGRWRNQGGAGQTGQLNRGRQGGKVPEYEGTVQRGGSYDRGFSHEEQSPHRGYSPGRHDNRYTYGGNSTYGVNHPPSGYSQYRGSHHPNDNAFHGSNGRHAPYNQQPPHHQQHFYQQPQQASYGNFPGGGSVMSGGSSRYTERSGYYTPDDRSIGSHHSHNSRTRSLGSNANSLAGMSTEGQNQHLILDLDAVENGLDTRTSLMVRNIPNKYTQQMLLTEFKENNHGPGVIDFFYLPIDFKNRCNRGYAFINFVDYHDILNFHRQYYGQHWRTFNSDKICDITYARIQGKAAMLKRFENSALMEKDEEYKPLVFVSSGSERGKRLPFPDSSRAT